MEKTRIAFDCDEEDSRAIHEAVATAQKNQQWMAVLPAGKCDLIGRVIAEICRGWTERQSQQPKFRPSIPDAIFTELQIMQKRLFHNGYCVESDLLYLAWQMISEENWAMGWNPIDEAVANRYWSLVVDFFGGPTGF